MEIEDWFELFKDRILTVHLHDCVFKGDSRPKDHLVIRKGNLDLEGIAKAVKRTGCKYVLIETYYQRQGKGDLPV